MFRTNSGKTIDLSRAKEIAAGGEGRIYESPVNKKKVIKIYHQARPASFENHLQKLSSLGPCFIKPQEIYFDSKGLVAGFDMDYVNFNDYWLFNNLFNKGFCNTNSITKDFKIKVLQSLKREIELVHTSGILIGDLNQYNIFISKKAEVLFVDTDSFATSYSKHSGIILDDVRDWTTLDINKSTDSWAYDILSFWVATFCHPFKWVVPGNKESLEQRVKTNKSFLSKIAGIKIPALYEALTGDVVKQFSDVFAGRRYMVDFDTVHISAPTIIKQPVMSTSLLIRELLTDVIEVFACRTAISANVTGKCKWVLVEAKTPQVTRQITEINCDKLYPAFDTYAYIANDVLYDAKGKKNVFGQPEFYYADGSLSVTDYSNDVQWNMNLSNQLAGIDRTSIPLFAKSITIRDVPIQNFGGAKYFNVPMKNTYGLIPVSIGTKNGYYSNGFVATESRDKSRMRYMLYHVGNSGDMDLGYLPHFAVKNDMVFIPDNGFISVYKDFNLLSKLDADICTRDSKLFSTDAGIVLFENKTVYLLNTKK